MTRRPVLIGATLSALLLSLAWLPAGPRTASAHQETLVTTRASGAFTARLTPLIPYDTAEGSRLGRMAIDKTFEGDLEATSVGEMLTAMTAVEGSAAYVALERVRGTLGGRRGTFALQHRGVMTHGAQDLLVTVVPDSGTDELEGLTGTMRIVIEAGRHAYEFEYAFGR